MSRRAPQDDWKHRTAARPGKPGQAVRPKRSRLWYALVMLLVAAGAAVGLLFFLKPKPEPLFLSLPVSEYEIWPVNLWAQNDGEALSEFFPGGKVPFGSQEGGDLILRELDELAAKTESQPGRGAVIHICALAMVDAEGVALLPAKADPDNRRTWLPLSRVLDSVRKFRGQRLLILDLRPVADLRLGQRGDELALAVHNELVAAEKAANLEFLVFAQCAPAEYPYVSPEFRHGVMAEFLRRGLAGHADTWNANGAKDDRVTAAELMAFTRARVADWQRTHGVPLAVPVRYGSDDDFILTTVSGGPPAYEIEAAAPPPAAVAKAWAELDAWRNLEADHRTPRTYRELEECVARADRQWLGVYPDDTASVRALDSLQTRLGPLVTQRDSFKMSGYPIATIGRARRIGIAKESEVVVALRPLFDGVKLPGAKSAELLGKIKPTLGKPPATPTFDAIVSAAAKEMADGPELSAEQLRVCLDVVRGLRPELKDETPADPEHLELALVALLANSEAVPFRSQWPAAGVRAAIKSMVEGEYATAGDGRTRMRIEAGLNAADADFRRCLLTFFRPSKPAWADATETLVRLPQRYVDIAELGRAYEEALYQWESTVALLPAIGDFPPDQPGAPRGVDVLWSELVAKTSELRRTLDGDADAATLRTSAKAVKELRDEFSNRIRLLRSDSGPVEIRARLRSPRWSSVEREQLSVRANTAALALAKTAVATNLTPGTAEVRVRPTEDAAFGEAASRRQRRAADLLTLVGEKPPEGAAATPRAWRTTLAGRLRERYDAAKDSADRVPIAWLIHPDELPAVPKATGPRQDPTPEARKAAEAAFARLVEAKRLRALADDLDALKPRPAAEALARELNEAARLLETWIP